MLGVTPTQIRELLTFVWANPRDDHARAVLADAYDVIGRRDIAMLWRDELPNYRRRKTVPKLTSTERELLEANFAWWRTNIVFNTSPAVDEDLLYAAVAALYRMDARHYAENLHGWPTVTWVDSPLAARRYLDRFTPATLGTELWSYVPTRAQQHISKDVDKLIFYTRNTYLPLHLTDIVQRSVEATADVNLGSMLSRSQFSDWLGERACALDILRLDYGTTNELSFRAVIALAQCTAGYYAFPNVFVAVKHPFIVENGTVPRWAWIDDRGQPHQWPATQ